MCLSLFWTQSILFIVLHHMLHHETSLSPCGLRIQFCLSEFNNLLFQPLSLHVHLPSLFYLLHVRKSLFEFFIFHLSFRLSLTPFLGSFSLTTLIILHTPSLFSYSFSPTISHPASLFPPFPTDFQRLSLTHHNNNQRNRAGTRMFTLCFYRMGA